LFYLLLSFLEPLYSRQNNHLNLFYYRQLLEKPEALFQNYHFWEFLPITEFFRLCRQEAAMGTKEKQLPLSHGDSRLTRKEIGEV
jgi:hypothetical protein